MTRLVNKKGLASIVLIAATIIFSGTSGSTLPASPAKHTIFLEAISVAFELPKRFVVLQWESHEGFYATGISFGEESRPHHFKRAPLEIDFWPGPKDCPQNASKPSECVDAEFERAKEERRRTAPSYPLGPWYVKLFGNKAVRYVTPGGLAEYVDIVGYFRTDQLPDNPVTRVAAQVSEYLVRIRTTIDVPQVKFDKKYKDLVDTVVNSLRIIK